ncbi:putative colanic acid biosynthesis UDP-glucose lipid carrier transferase [Pontibacter ummariensis]|uniref:Putative colanic acid biosysnthesis UDP-glucose lipid carrier transferase n=1 Tax=Pontibacter ummariensis TaxID=1610492 RepID=A0A239GF03_9BACT|nr:undecaprenyl-phosphate glucose phosphotransferase [Pontibacter ummariensis]PRY11218.1 putative colanic acid biosynthesis UDP-glucose lipid carrier transferase [Pontibacter ummariensis]SNS67312.1 putative colanic acid biosysnthesis UDP-glucose lipid carrier transferase [Pontibacter ummariensis]
MSKFRHYYSFNRVFLLILDVTLIAFAFKLSNLIRYGSLEMGYEYNVFFVLFALVWWIVSGFDDYVFRVDRLLPCDKRVSDLLSAFVLHAFILASCIVIFNLEELSRLLLLYTYLSTALLISVSRLLLSQVFRYYTNSDMAHTRYVIVGAGPAAAALFQTLSSNDDIGTKFMGVFDDSVDPGNPLSSQIKGCVDDLKEYCLQHSIDEVYYTLPLTNKEQVDDLTAFADENFVYFRLVPDFSAIVQKDVNMYFYHNIPMISVRKEPLEIASNRIAKRLFDVAFSLAVILFIFPVLLPIIALAIRLESKGPIFFKQLRPGKKNKLFVCYKFRTMRVNTQTELQATKNDPRITKVGAFLRKTSMDELPQFFNVLLGDMSVVGPRPNLISQLDHYSKLISKYKMRHFVTPGITGYAQVSGFRGETKELHLMEKRVEYDVRYMENWSLMMDMKIIFLTVWNMIKGEKNAY